MGKRGLFLVFLVFGLVAVVMNLADVNAQMVCPDGDCTGNGACSYTNPPPLVNCIGNDIDTLVDSCLVGNTKCMPDGTWDECSGWKASDYEPIESSCEGSVDNDCDGVIDSTRYSYYTMRNGENFGTARDTHIIQISPDSNQETNNYMFVKSETGRVQNSLIWFLMSLYNENIYSAKIQFSENTFSPDIAELGLYQLTPVSCGSWLGFPSSSTWNNRYTPPIHSTTQQWNGVSGACGSFSSSDYIPVRLAKAYYYRGNGDITYNVTGSELRRYFEDATNNAVLDTGLLIKSEEAGTEISYARFYSSNNPAIGERPKLFLKLEGTDTNVCAPSTTCELTSVVLTPDCSAGMSTDCEAGETIIVDAMFANDCSASTIDNLQVDASFLTSNECDIKYQDIPAGEVEITNSINVPITIDAISNTASGIWIIPDVATVAPSCLGKLITPTTGYVYTGLPDTGTLEDDTLDAGDSISGTFTFFDPLAISTSTTTSTSTSVTTTFGGGSLGFCGDNSLDVGEQCDSNGLDADCSLVDASPGANLDTCDQSGVFTGVPCTCFSSTGPSGSETVIFTTECQDDGDGDQNGYRTEETIVYVGGIIDSQTSTRESCTLPPLNVPGFNIISLIITAGLLIGYYCFISRKQ